MHIDENILFYSIENIGVGMWEMWEQNTMLIYRKIYKKFLYIFSPYREWYKKLPHSHKT